MNIPSLSYIYRKASKTIRRFPFALLASVLAAICGVWLVGLEYSERQSYEFLYPTIMVSVLGISFFTFIVLTLEKNEKSRLWFLAGQFVGLGLLILYYLVLPEDFFNALEKYAIQYALFLLGTHLLVAIAPFGKKGEINAFWQYNRTLFLRFLTALLYTHVLYLGLIVAMLSIDHLFGVDLPDEWYGQLWILIVGIFNTWFFLSGIPENLGQLENRRDYPKGLKVLTQYILIPLVIIYLLILYLYAGKIIIEWQWPEGWVAILILSFSVAGIFSLLLLYPIREKVENRWIRSFSKYYYISLIPLVIMLLLAIWRRISEYGFTENRYFVLILGFWLAGIVIYFIFSRTGSIKVIPGTLCIITFFVSFGPWGAFSVSENSQINRLESLLSENRILTGGKIQNTNHAVPSEDVREISAIVRYLADVHGLDEIQPWFEENLDSLVADTTDTARRIDRFNQPKKVVELMGLQYTEAWEDNFPDMRSFTANTDAPIQLQEYEWMVRNRNFNQDQHPHSIHPGQHTLIVEMNPDSLWFSIHKKDDESAGELKMNFRSKVEELDRSFGLQESYNIPQEQMILENENDWIKIRLNLNSIHLQKEQEEWTVQNISADMFISIKE